MKIKLENTICKKIIASVITSISAIVLVTCSQSTEPKPLDNKDPREMTWTTDTLEFPSAIQTLMGSIWASSPNDVHAVGFCDDSEGSYWHYNGVDWECTNLFDYVDRGSLVLKKVWGFAENDFWIVGERGIFDDESFIIHYNGEWNDHKSVSKAHITDVAGPSSNDIWFTGMNGIVIYKYHNFWRVDTVKFSFPDNTSYGNMGIAKMDEELFILAVSRNPHISLNREYFIRGNLYNWVIADSVIIPNLNWTDNAKWGGNGIFQTLDEETFSFGLGGIWQWHHQGESWNRIFEGNFTIRGLKGMDSNYLLATADFGRFFYFDGTEWMTITNIITNQENIHFYDVWTDGREVFVLGHITDSFPMRTIVLHGK